MRNIFFVVLIFFIAIGSSCNKQIYYSREAKHWKDTIPDSTLIEYSTYLIGDAGEPSITTTEPSFKLLKSMLDKDTNSSVVFLGDNIYYKGLPTEKDRDRARMEKKINEQLKIVENFKGKIFFIAGNHDWEYMGPGGYEAVKREEIYIENYLKRGDTYVPDFGCPGPYKIDLNENTILIAIDSQWWLHNSTKPYGQNNSCSAEDGQDMMTQLEDIIKKNKDRNIIVAAHHPLFSNGNHGGYFSIMDYIFPLNIIRKNAYIPLPIIGSIYPLFRKFGGSNQDLSSYRYQAYKNDLMKIFSKYDNIIYAAGHEHNLQFHKAGTLNHILSGSGSKVNDVGGGNDATFVQKEKGFVKVSYYKNGQVWAEYWNPVKDGSTGKLSFRTMLYSRKEIIPESFCTLSHVDYQDSSKNVVAHEDYKRGIMGRIILGGHYRKEWSTPIKVKYLDLATEQGGLIPYAKGGRKQTISLKVKNLDDKEFTLRTINKFTVNTIPSELHNTLVDDILDDQISAQHPYGALTVPKISTAAGVLHTEPKLVYMPADSCLGPYREEFKGMLMLFEEDPTNNHEQSPNLGNSKNIVGTQKMREKIEDDNDNVVDEKSFCRARLLDMLLGDWDRHEKQFRWASYETKKGTLYKVIPEDRDQVYFKFDGALPFLLSRKWTIRNLQDFDYTFEDIKGLNMSAKFIDKRLLSSLSEKDWIAIADSMKASISDKIIEDAIHDMPPEVFQYHGDEIIAKLKSRRDLLPQAASKYYKILAKYVDIYGSNKDEKYVVERLNNAEVKVTIFKIGKKGESKQELYNRTFKRSETKEIRLYGLDGNDVFLIDGKVKKSIKVRVIGGSDRDSLVDHSDVKGIKKMTTVYDTKEDNNFEFGHETNDERSNDPSINSPDEDVIQYNYLGPQASLFYNETDGLFLGGGILYKTYKFRGAPYGSQHRFLANYATKTGSFRIYYQGEQKKFIGNLDLVNTIQIYNPAYVMNYFGYGNESKFNKADDIANHRVRLSLIYLNPSISKTFSNFFTAGIGPKYESFKLESATGSYADQTLAGQDPTLYQLKQYGGVRGFFRLGTRDNNINPTRGILLTAESQFNKNLKTGSNYSQHTSDFSFYISPNLPFQLTFAGRIGGGMNFGSYEFYQANMLGGGNMIGLNQNLRGFVKTRFIGDRSLYQNFEVRSQLFRFNLYLCPAKFGILGLVDNGRVWAKGEDSHIWHTGAGGGIWLSILNKLVITGTYTVSKENALVNLKTGFFF